MFGFGERTYVLEEQAHVELYNEGVKCLQQQKYYEARDIFTKLLEINPTYKSALFNLAQIHNSAAITPFDLDLSAKLIYFAASLGHQACNGICLFLSRADSCSLGFETLLMYADFRVNCPMPINPLVFLITSRYFASIVTRDEEIANLFINYELDRIKSLKQDWGLKFLNRLGISESVYYGASVGEVQEDSIHGQMIYCLNELDKKFEKSGIDFKYREFFRISVVSYVINKASYKNVSICNEGLDTFFNLTSNDELNFENISNNT